ncbi:MAG: peptidase C69 [Planctomycetes bacterium]|nr:peptidase C69 [Planctomycetota bacterium]
MKTHFTLSVFVLLFTLILILPVSAAFTDDSDLIKMTCTSFAAGRLATIDGSTMSGHTCDGNCDFTIRVVPRRTYGPADKVHIDYAGVPGGFGHTIHGETPIPQVPVTYKYFHLECPIGNEFQVFFGENTCGTKREFSVLSRDEAMLDYTQVAALALQRGTTAREAIRAAGELIEKYGMLGLGGSGESFLVTDPTEAWCFEIVGQSNQWVAQRIPDDHVCPHANRMRIQEIDLSNREYFMASPNLISHAIDRGVYNPDTDGPFNFAKVYSGNNSRGNQIREWRMLCLLCPSKKWDIDAESFPFSVKPDKKIDARWWIENVWRDHLDGTEFETTKGLTGGPFESPAFARLVGLSSERAICTPGSGYTWVSQARDWLPDPVGGVVWFGLDCPRSTCYVPFYVGISDTPKSWQQGDFTKFDPESPRWYFQVIDTFSWLKYNQIHKDVREVFGALEEEEFSEQAYIDKVATELYNEKPALAEDFLTQYSQGRALKAEKAAKDLFYQLLTKYAEGGPRAQVSPFWQNIIRKDR